MDYSVGSAHSGLFSLNVFHGREEKEKKKWVDWYILLRCHLYVCMRALHHHLCVDITPSSVLYCDCCLGREAGPDEQVLPWWTWLSERNRNTVFSLRTFGFFNSVLFTQTQENCFSPNSKTAANTKYIWNQLYDHEGNERTWKPAFLLDLKGLHDNVKQFLFKKCDADTPEAQKILKSIEKLTLVLQEVLFPHEPRLDRCGGGGP